MKNEVSLFVDIGKNFKMILQVKSALARLHAVVDVRDAKSGMNETVANSLLYHRYIIFLNFKIFGLSISLKKIKKKLGC